MKTTTLHYLKDVVTLSLDAEKCIGCRMCIEVCPHEVFKIVEKKAVIKDKDACMECGACKRNCPVGAISVNEGVGCAAYIFGGSKGCGEDSNCCS